MRTSTITYRTTKYEYGQVGNTTEVITPRRVDAANADDLAARTEYGAMNRPVKQYQPYDPADSRYNKANVYTQTFYDGVGRVSKTSTPPSEGQTVRNDTSYTYFDNGWAKSSTAPWDIVTTYSFDKPGKQTARTLTSAAGSSNRAMTWSRFPDGKLKSKSDDRVPVGSAVVLVDDSDTQNTSAAGTWTKGSLTGQQGYDHQVHAAGAGTGAFTWTLDIPKNGTYTAYVKYPKVTEAATAAKYTVTKSDGTTTDVTAILLVAGWLRSKQPEGGGEVTMDLQQSGGLHPRNAIPGGSAQNPGLNTGCADLIYWTDTTVYIWDAKHAGGSAEAGGRKAVQNEVDALQGLVVSALRRQLGGGPAVAVEALHLTEVGVWGGGGGRPPPPPPRRAQLACGGGRGGGAPPR
ncbi:hypothetical protein ACIPEK_41045, partial [Streptomyces sp. NPDC088246]